MAKQERVIMDFEGFLKLCRDADILLASLKHNLKLKGRRRRYLKAAAIHYLARKRGQNVTFHHLYLIYTVDQGNVRENKKLLKSLNGNRSVRMT